MFNVRLPRPSKDDKQIINVLQPNVCAICDPAKINKHGYIGVPNIAAEILSSGNKKKELKNKYEIYEEADVLEYRIRHPKETTILKYVVDVKVILTFTIFDSGR